MAELPTAEEIKDIAGVVVFCFFSVSITQVNQVNHIKPTRQKQARWKEKDLAHVFLVLCGCFGPDSLHQPGDLTHFPNGKAKNFGLG